MNEVVGFSYLECILNLTKEVIKCYNKTIIHPYCQLKLKPELFISLGKNIRKKMKSKQNHTSILYLNNLIIGLIYYRLGRIF